MLETLASGRDPAGGAVSVIRMPIVVMGVSGSGKTSVGGLLASRLGMEFLDADQLHPPGNKRKMAAGMPLDDDDRQPWLARIADRLQAGALVVACSALKRSHRDRLRLDAADIRFVYLRGSTELLRQRIARRSHEFMPASLLDSQLQTLEPPQADERALTVDIGNSVQENVECALRWLEATSGDCAS
jgi:carbohydrate kinase (thermoresistant glucokinase family)